MDTAYLVGIIVGALANVAGFAVGWWAHGQVELLGAANSTAGDDGSVGP